MGSTYARGFTVIETMMFLAITGILVVGILYGTGTSINVQRYRDSVLSLQTTLQDQYSQVVNVRNEVSLEGLSCDTNAVVTVDPDAGSAPRGQADCVVMGRYVRTLDSRTLSLSTVVGYINPNAVTNTNDLQTLQLYALNTIPTSEEEYPIEWNAELQQAGGDMPLAFSVLILRSPTSGIVRTFINPTVSMGSDTIDDLVDTAYLSQSLKACVDAGGLFGTNKMAVSIVPNATSATGVEILGDGSSQC